MQPRRIGAAYGRTVSMKAPLLMSTPTSRNVERIAMTYRVRSLVDGFPGKSASHGGFGWSSVYLAESDEHKVLVETGPPAYIPLLSEGLARLGTAADQITDVLLTHSHWDHLANIMMFPNARLWIGESELAWAADQGADVPFMSTLHVRRLLDLGEAVGRVSDGDEMLPGITALSTPGHTPGHLAFRVEGESGPAIFAGDSVKNVYELATGIVDSTMDRETSTQSIARLREMMAAQDASLIPGHDVPLRLAQGQPRRTVAQTANIEFFSTAREPAIDCSISDSINDSSTSISQSTGGRNSGSSPR